MQRSQSLRLRVLACCLFYKCTRFWDRWPGACSLLPTPGGTSPLTHWQSVLLWFAGVVQDTDKFFPPDAGCILCPEMTFNAVGYLRSNSIARHLRFGLDGSP